MSFVSPKPELLLPAGSPEKLRYAIAYGADAVYLGLPMASLRTPSRGEQFTPGNLAGHLDYAHARGVKTYVTINIFPSNRDLARIIPHLEQLEGFGAGRPGGIILSDPGVFRLARKYAPSVPIHLSTQANTLNVEACAFWQDLGVERVILAREVPLREIAEIHEQLPTLELECFVHGSLCVAYSGRCVISDYLTDNTKNSNKGMCGNSCRWEFESANGEAPAGGEHAQNGHTHNDQGGCNGHSAESELTSLEMREVSRPHDVYTFEEDEKGTYMLNSKDLCLVEHLRRLQDAGIVSFKVEGRTKSLYYVATAGRIYREAIDYFQTHAVAPETLVNHWVSELSQAGNRGFTEGFLEGRPTNKAYNYQDAKSQQGAMFIGTVASAGLAAATASGVDAPVDVDVNAGVAPDREGRILVQARNGFSRGDMIDWITPAGCHSTRLDTIADAHGLPVERVGTNQLVYLAPPAGVDAQALLWSVLRRREKVPVAR